MTDPLGTPPTEPALRVELLDRAARDQAARHAHQAAVETGAGDWSAVTAIDEDNLAFLTPLIERHGWLGSDLVGVDGAHVCWLLVQHAPPAEQDQWLPLLERAVSAGLAAERDLAYLRDRVNMHHNRRQVYGTQYLGFGSDSTPRLWPVIDPTLVNQRRRALGLHPLDADTVDNAWTEPELADHGRSLSP